LEVLERSHSLEEASAEHAPELQVKFRFGARIAGCANTLFQSFHDRLEVVKARKLLQTLV
jgi:hypothetical protein